MSDVEQVRSGSFAIADERLWPPICPDCGYSWKGLPHARCPECGESVEEGEVVLIGESLNDRGAVSGRNLSQDLLGLAMAVVVAGVVVAFQGVSAAGIVLLGASFLVIAAVLLLFHFARRRLGVPKGVVRLSGGGFRIGAGETKGRQIHWNQKSRVSIQFKDERIILEYHRIWCGITLYRTLGLRVGGDWTLYNGIHERLAAWTSGRIKVRT